MPAEKDIRRGKDVLVAGIVETQKQVGMLPDVALAEKWADPIIHETDKTLTEAEEKAKLSPKKKAVEEKPLEEGQRGGLVNWDLKTDKLTPQKGAKLKVYFVPQKQEDILIYKRLKLLAKYPEWKTRVLNAWFAPLPPWMDAKEKKSHRADRILKIIEDSDKIFGERKVKEKPRKLIVG